MSISKITSLTAALLLLVVTIAFCAEPGRKTLRDTRPPAVSRLVPVGQLPATTNISLAIGLPLRDEAGLDELLRQLYDPQSTNYHKFLTPEQFTARFGPSESDYALVKSFALTNGFTITGTNPTRLLLDVRASSAAVERAFHLTLRTYRHPHEARNFFAPDAVPTVEAIIPIQQISGLDNYSSRRPMSVVQSLRPTAPVVPHAGSGPGGNYLGDDFRTAYVSGTTLTGRGQSVALVQFDGYYSNDIAAYINLAGRTNYPISLTNIDVNGGVAVPGSGNIEACLDIEMVIAMAPGVSQIIVYEAPNSGTAWSTMLGKIAGDNLASQIACSWGNSSPGAKDVTSENFFKQMAVQGQSFFNATGDSDAFVGGIPFPSESPNITQVGGTTLSTTGPAGEWSSESAWNRGGGTGTGGGVSANYEIPGWQIGISMVSNQGSSTQRNVPDVALTGENVFITYNNGDTATVGGTSCAAPLWAAFMALVNEQTAAAGRAPAGFINPMIYALATGTNYTSYFHDTTAGDNFWSGSPTNYPATDGYDLCTGWGTPNGTNLINALAGLADPFGITPKTRIGFSGSNGGPFVVTSRIFGLTNAGGSSLDWQLAGAPAWLSVQPPSGSLAAGGQTSVAVSLNSVASNLAVGSYHADLMFSNLTTSFAQVRSVDLVVFSPSILENGGFETGDFTGWTLNGNSVIGTSIYNAVVSAGSFPNNSGTVFIHSGMYGAFLGDTPEIGTWSQTLTTLPGQAYLLSFWLVNPVSGAGQQFLVNWNTNSSDIGQIYYVTNPPAMAWTNLTFVVTATDTNTTLQFGAENEPDGFGLDDITVIPIPAPSFTAFFKQAGSFSLAWNTLPGVAYQVQYQTNLLETNWLILADLTATDSITSFTNAPDASPQGYYRIRQIP